MQISKAKIRYINSLSLKKNRDSEQVFIAEGSKLVLDLIPHFKVGLLVATQQWYNTNYVHVGHLNEQEVLIVDSENEIKKVSQMTTPPPVLCVFRRNTPPTLQNILQHDDIILMLDSIQDPGNLGTIIRTADWFGLKYIVCSEDTVDLYNPKVINSTMGALARVQLVYVDKIHFLQYCVKIHKYIYGTFLGGENIYNATLKSQNAVLVMGNEGNGISAQVAKYIKQKITIPSFQSGGCSESLNVAIATAITLSEMRR